MEFGLFSGAIFVLGSYAFGHAWFFEMSLWVFPKIVGFPPKSSILIIGFSIINHPFWGTFYFWEHPFHVAKHLCLTLIYGVCCCWVLTC